MLDGALVSDRFERALECHVALHSTPRCTCPAHAEASSASCAKPFGYEDFDSWMESFIDNGRNSVHTAGAKSVRIAYRQPVPLQRDLASRDDPGA